MRRRSVRTALGVALGLVLLAPAAAHAETKVAADDRGDVRVVTLVDERSAELPPSRASRTEVGDVVRTSVSHTRRTIGVRLRLAQLRRGDTLVHFTLAGSNGRRGSISIHAFEANTEGVVMTGLDSRGCDDRRIRYRLDHRADVVSLRVPRVCLGNPQRVRAAAYVAWFREPRDDDAESVDIVYDDAFRVGGELPDDVDDVPAFSEAVRRGR